MHWIQVRHNNDDISKSNKRSHFVSEEMNVVTGNLFVLIEQDNKTYDEGFVANKKNNNTQTHTVLNVSSVRQGGLDMECLKSS